MNPKSVIMTDFPENLEIIDRNVENNLKKFQEKGI